MKKTIIALFALSAVAFGGTLVDKEITISSTDVEGATKVDNTTQLDIAWTATPTSGDYKDVVFTNTTCTITTVGESVNIKQIDGYGLTTADATLTMNVQGALNISSELKRPAGQLNIVTTITDQEHAALYENGTTSRWVVTTDVVRNFSTSTTSLTLNGLTGYQDGGFLVFYNDNYYSMSDVTATGIYLKLSQNAVAINVDDLDAGRIYTTLKITGQNVDASVKGIGFLVTVPEPATATLSLLALAGLAARRRRK